MFAEDRMPIAAVDPTHCTNKNARDGVVRGDSSYKIFSRLHGWERP